MILCLDHHQMKVLWCGNTFLRESYLYSSTRDWAASVQKGSSPSGPFLTIREADDPAKGLAGGVLICCLTPPPGGGLGLSHVCSSLCAQCSSCVMCSPRSMENAVGVC